jgi:hypothetical protein
LSLVVNLCVSSSSRLRRASANSPKDSTFSANCRNTSSLRNRFILVGARPFVPVSPIEPLLNERRAGIDEEEWAFTSIRSRVPTCRNHALGTKGRWRRRGQRRDTMCLRQSMAFECSFERKWSEASQTRPSRSIHAHAPGTTGQVFCPDASPQGVNALQRRRPCADNR